MKSRTLLLSTLVQPEVCSGQVDLFKQTFGDSVEVTTELCKKYASDFDWSWAASNLISASAQKIYDETCAPARKVCNEICASAWKIYDETCTSAWKIYYETRAETFANLYIGE